MGFLFPSPLWKSLPLCELCNFQWLRILTRIQVCDNFRATTPFAGSCDCCGGFRLHSYYRGGFCLCLFPLTLGHDEGFGTGLHSSLLYRRIPNGKYQSVMSNTCNYTVVEIVHGCIFIYVPNPQELATWLVCFRTLNWSSTSKSFRVLIASHDFINCMEKVLAVEVNLTWNFLLISLS